MAGSPIPGKLLMASLVFPFHRKFYNFYTWPAGAIERIAVSVTTCHPPEKFEIQFVPVTNQLQSFEAKGSRAEGGKVRKGQFVPQRIVYGGQQIIVSLLWCPFLCFSIHHHCKISQRSFPWYFSLYVYIRFDTTTTGGFANGLGIGTGEEFLLWRGKPDL